LGVLFIFDTKLLLYCFREEADEFVEIGALNGLFVLGRSIGFIGKSVCLLLSNVSESKCLFTPGNTVSPC